MDFIDDLRQKDDDNYQQISKLFSVELGLCNTLVDLYGLCTKALPPHLKDVGVRVGHAFACGLARNHLVRDCL